MFGIRMYDENRAFAARAKSAEGTVIDFERQHTPGDDSREDTTYAIVRFATDDGRQITFRGPSVDGLAKLRQNDTVRVLYEPADPTVAKVDSYMGLWFGPTMLGGMGAGAILIPLLTLWQVWKWCEQQER
jgi:hypothetical protein